MSEDLLNITGKFMATELDFIEKCNKEKEELQQRIDKAIDYCKENIQICKDEQCTDEWECCIEELQGVAI